MSEITVYTTAPEAYDGFSTRVVTENAGTDNQGKTIRVVTMESVDYEWQTGRYRSGLYAAYSETEAGEEFACGLWTRS